MVTYVPPLRELFIAYYESEPTRPGPEWARQHPERPPSPPDIAWHGSAPRLGTPDGDASYAHVNEHGPYVGPTPVIELPAGVDYSEAVIHAQVRSGGPFWPQIILTDGTMNGYNGDVFDDWNERPGGEWVTVSIPVTDWAGGYPDPASTVIAGIAHVWHNPATVEWDVSWLAVSIPGGARPLQWRARTDGLGSSGVQPARSASTFQATGRARGMV